MTERDKEIFESAKVFHRIMKEERFAFAIEIARIERVAREAHDCMDAILRMVTSLNKMVADDSDTSNTAQS